MSILFEQLYTTRVHIHCSIARGTFNTLSELVSLDLKGNEISSVEDRSFSGLPALKQLDLSSNRIQLLARDTFSGSFEQTVPPTSRVLYLYGTHSSPLPPRGMGNWLPISVCRESMDLRRATRLVPSVAAR